MKLRYDPTANAVMAGAYTRANAGPARRAARPQRHRRRTLHRAFPRIGRGGPADHAGRGTARHCGPARPFRGRRKANPSIFYDRGGRARSVARRLSRAGQSLCRGAAATPARRRSRRSLPRPAPESKQAVARRPTRVRARHRGDYPGLCVPRRACPNCRRDRDAAPVFHGLFRTSARREAVAPVVSALWTRARSPVRRRQRPRTLRSRPRARPRTGSPQAARSTCSRTAAPMRARCSAAGSDAVKNPAILAHIYGERVS